MSDRLQQIVAKSLMLDESRVGEDLEYNSIPEWDSVAHMVLVADLEDAFELMLDTDDIIAMSSVGKIREILRKHGADV
jgi:acyl carrier protein